MLKNLLIAVVGASILIGTASCRAVRRQAAVFDLLEQVSEGDKYQLAIVYKDRKNKIVGIAKRGVHGATADAYRKATALPTEYYQYNGERWVKIQKPADAK